MDISEAVSGFSMKGWKAGGRQVDLVWNNG